MFIGAYLLLYDLIGLQLLLDETVEVLRRHRGSGVDVRVDLGAVVEVALLPVLTLPLLPIAV